jgi:outer membrane protein TolC
MKNKQSINQQRMKKKSWMLFFLLAGAVTSMAQTKSIRLEEAIQLGIQNSKQLKLSQSKIDQAVSQFEQSKDAALPSAKVSAGYSQALMLANKLSIPGDSGKTSTVKLPFDNTLYQATLSFNEPIFAGNQFKYAKASADLLVHMSRLDAEKDRDEVVYTIVSTYLNYYKIEQSQVIVQQNLDDIQSKLDEITKYESQGLATQNDVLRYQLQKSNTELTILELENNRKIANYNMNILLGLADTITVKLQEVTYKLDIDSSFDQFLQQALKDRKEFGVLSYQDRIADINVKKIHDQQLPTVGVGGSLYYFNLSKPLIPKSGAFLAPFVIGINASWDISSLYKTKNKLTEAKIEKQQVSVNRDLASDRIKTEVHQDYMQYHLSLERIKVLQSAITQASENERVMESKFHNNLATTTDRIDAQTMLYQSRVNLELAKSDATISYYNLLKSIGHIGQ